MSFMDINGLMQQLIMQQSLMFRYSVAMSPGVMSPVTASYSPLSSSCCSNLSTPVKLDQEEPLNLCVREQQQQPIPWSVFHTSWPKLEPELNNKNMLQSLPQPRKRALASQRKSRQFKCNQCRSVFACLASLTEHTHSDHGGYRCHVCATPFTQRSNLQRHALRHVGFRPYSCGVCLREYYRKDHLIRHITVSHRQVGTPKHHIIQRMSSSESLGYIEQYIVNKTNDSVKLDQTSDQLTDSVTDEDEECGGCIDDEEEYDSGISNVFLSKADMEIDIVN